jgi:acyl-CoA reductase-like NAD-dependent aldehyde dehydrogenase
LLNLDPLILTLEPLIGAIAAGCPTVVKVCRFLVSRPNRLHAENFRQLSELCENVSALLESLMKNYLDQSVIRVVNGGPREATELLKHKFGHIFYTGENSAFNMAENLGDCFYRQQYCWPRRQSRCRRAPYADNTRVRLFS